VATLFLLGDNPLNLCNKGFGRGEKPPCFLLRILAITRPGA
jgi:hypothetical protein